MLLLGRKTAIEKVSSFPLMIAKAREADGTEQVEVPVTRSDVADYLGLTIETVSGVMTKIRQDGLIKLPPPARIEIRDRGQLEELAAGETGPSD